MKYLLVITLFLSSCIEKSRTEYIIESKIGSHQAPIEKHKQDIINPQNCKDGIVHEYDYSYTIIEGYDGWGYQIYKDGIMKINQKHIPSIPGIKGFETKEKATITANYILKKMEEGNFLPIINKEILDSLKVI